MGYMFRIAWWHGGEPFPEGSFGSCFPSCAWQGVPDEGFVRYKEEGTNLRPCAFFRVSRSLVSKDFAHETRQSGELIISKLAAPKSCDGEILPALQFWRINKSRRDARRELCKGPNGSGIQSIYP